MNDSIVLCRISDLKQDDGYSLDAQERYGVEYCKRNQFAIQKVFRFVETGSKSHKREKFDGMMDYIREYVAASKTKTLHLVVEKPDRLTRNFTNREQLQFFVMTGRLVIHYYKDRRILDRNCSPADIFTDDMMTSVSKYIALNIARETRKGMNEKAKNGWFPGHAPLGYKNHREGSTNKHGRKEAKIVPDEETKKAVQRIFELRALRGCSYWAIRDQILEEKLLPEKRAKRFSKSSVETVLTNPFYEGKFFWDGEWHQGKHELFIPIDWIRIVDGRRGTPNVNSPVGPFSHLMTCGVPGCGSTIIYDPKIKVNKTTGESRLYHYYHCADGRRFHKLNNIAQVNVRQEKLWELFEQPVRELTISEDVAKIIMEQVIENGKKSQDSVADVRARARDRIAQLAGKEDELYEHWVSGLLTKDAYARHLERLKQDRQEIEDKLASLENVDENGVEEKTKVLLELCKLAELAWNNGGEEQRLSLLKRFCSNFRLDGANVCFDLKKPFAKILEFKKNTDSTKWCPGPDLNWHVSLTQPRILSPVRLPISPPGHEKR